MGHNKNNRFNENNEKKCGEFINEEMPENVAIDDVAEQPEETEDIAVATDENSNEIESLKNLLQKAHCQGEIGNSEERGRKCHERDTADSR